jgi:hypothetical protein
MTKYKIIDNYLNNVDFAELTSNFFPNSVAGVPTIGWNYNREPVVVEEPDRFKKVTDIEILNSKDNWALSHVVLAGAYQSPVLNLIIPLIKKINPMAFFRIQANLSVQQEKRRRTLFHMDYDYKTIMTTSIFYVNTTNGPTILEDGTEIECRANRLISFPYETYHAGVLCTDQHLRGVINLNYFQQSAEKT